MGGEGVSSPSFEYEGGDTLNDVLWGIGPRRGLTDVLTPKIQVRSVVLLFCHNTVAFVSHCGRPPVGPPQGRSASPVPPDPGPTPGTPPPGPLPLGERRRARRELA